MMVKSESGVEISKLSDDVWPTSVLSKLRDEGLNSKPCEACAGEISRAAPIAVAAAAVAKNRAPKCFMV